jgi:uncharacterized protein YbjQ (UPF0145 family)
MSDSIYLIYSLLSLSPWIASLIGTLIYQNAKKETLLQREKAHSVLNGDKLSTLSKPLGGREIKEFTTVMASVVMSPSWIQITIGRIVTLFGGEINVFTKIIDWARREAKQRLREDISKAGFDEVINLRLETSIITKTNGGNDKTSGVEIIAYGTAIKY